MYAPIPALGALPWAPEQGHVSTRESCTRKATHHAPFMTQQKMHWQMIADYTWHGTEQPQRDMRMARERDALGELSWLTFKLWETLSGV